MKRSRTVLAFGLAGVGIVAALSGASAQSTLPDGPGKEVVEQNCVACHGLEVVTAQRRTPDGWVEIVNTMVGNGASLTDDQYKQVVAYLQTHLGPVSGSTAAPVTAHAAK